MDIDPAMLPWWWPVVALPAALWARDQFWPWFRSLVDAEFKARRDGLERARGEAEARYLTALSTWSGAQVEVAAAMKTMSDARLVDNLILARIERRLDEIESALGRSGILQRRRNDERRNEQQARISDPTDP